MAYKKRTLRVLSRHPSHDSIRRNLLCDHLAVIRFGSETPSKHKIQINSIESIKNSANKQRMKTCFDAAKINTPNWLFGNFTYTEDGISKDNVELHYPIIAKKFYGSRNNGNTLIQNRVELDTYLNSNRYNINNTLFEQYHTYNKEYRLHVTKEGCFYTCRKMLREDAQDRWYRNDSNCVWYLESNPNFNKPNTWNDIVNHCVKAIAAVGLDIGACDVIVNNKGLFKILEVNSAASFAEITEQKYREVLPKLVNLKAKEL